MLGILSNKLRLPGVIDSEKASGRVNKTLELNEQTGLEYQEYLANYFSNTNTKDCA